MLSRRSCSAPVVWTEGGRVPGVESSYVMDYTGLTMEDVQQEDYRNSVIHPEVARVRAHRAPQG